jgi:hypothetical protein
LNDDVLGVEPLTEPGRYIYRDFNFAAIVSMDGTPPR